MAAGKALLALALAAVALALLSTALAYVRSARSTEAAGVTPADCRDATVLSRLVGLPEASGLTVSRSNPDLLWSHNDSADPVIFGIGRDGSIKSRIRVTGAIVEDWEAVTTAPCPQGSCVYIGDIGDNRAIRARITIYRTPEPMGSATETARAESFAAVYPEGPQDAEGLFATSDGTLYVVTKGDGAPVHIYRVPALNASTPVRLTRIATLSAAEATKGGRVTDAAMSPDGNWTALRSNDKLLFYKTADLMAGQPNAPREFDLRQLREPQGEGLAWAGDNTLYLAGEGGGGGTFARVSCTLPSP